MKTSLLIKALVQKVYSSFSFHLPTIQLFISPWVKSYEDIYHSPPHVSVITRNTLTKIIRFARYHLLASNSTLMTDSMYLGTIQTCRKLNKNFHYLISITSVIWQIDANCSPFQLPNIPPFHIRLSRLKRYTRFNIKIFLNTTLKKTQIASFFIFICVYHFRI